VSVLIAALVVASQSTLQGPTGSRIQVPSRFQVGGDFVVSQPKSELATNIGNGYGFNLTGMLRLDPRGYFNIRADGGMVQYGKERQRVPLFPISGRINVDIETTNQIAWGGIGTQLQIPDGWLRPYANASIAFTDFFTETSLSGSDNSFEPISTKNQGDYSRAWIFGGGVNIPFGNNFTNGMLNLGARYYYGGEATYLRRGDIIDNPDGTITLNPRRSKTDLVLWQLGFSLAIPRWSRQ
jgi:hypothetical protein